MKRAGLLKYWLPAIAWACVVLGASTDLMSAEHTSRFIAPFLRWLDPHIATSTIMHVQFFVRKCAHLTEYGVLGCLLLRAFASTTGTPTLRDAAKAVGAAATCAAVDEFHQTFVPSRTGTPVDVMIDVCGATIGVAIYCWVSRRLKHSRAGR